ncbi:hypothetical protein Nepgr_028095 [Nepenthes gracilis]|uniref:Uncharacterized protein n=1 Tax=Nepenthes gracilis TaxID=150966 RepID=A0AAD3TCZ0_NEPGR|nr:hypothetical protein Nepgr_028095 [Nepenthes gracilis]
MAISKLNLSYIQRLLVVILVIDALVSQINCSETRILDETTVPGSSDPGNKCGGCSSCSNPCGQSPPPPPPPSPPPPTPVLPSCPPPPPPPPKKPPIICPPPPGLIYLIGPPGDLYPIDNSSSAGLRSFAVGLPALMGFGLVCLLKAVMVI